MMPIAVPPSSGDPKIIAFVLPQFHRMAENDRWWGEGFTEWVNVKRAKPLFKDHRQPRVPKDQNYYDLCDERTQEWQAQLARAHGVAGFCYYHYWFNGHRLLHKPVDLLLQRGKPDFPFCLAWANEPWTRAWDGGDREILMPQTYGKEAEWDAHFAELLRAFKDPRYIRIGGKPVFLIYRSASIEECAAMLARWRALALLKGFPGLHLVQMLTGFERDQREGLFDAFAEFEPMYTMYHHLSRWQRRQETLARHRAKLMRLLTGVAPHAPNSFQYRRVWQSMMVRPGKLDHYPGGFVDWDNSPRRALERAIIFRGFSIEVFETGLRAQFEKARGSGAPFVFINAWNEWAESTYLEPDEHNGTRLLEAVLRVVNSTAGQSP